MRFRTITSVIYILCHFLLYSIIIYLDGQKLIDKIMKFIYISEGSRQGYLDLNIEIVFVSTTECIFKLFKICSWIHEKMTPNA